MLTRVALGIVFAALLVQPNTSFAAVSDDLAELAAYRGIYRTSATSAVGIDAFVMDDGSATLLYADYRTGLVRRLFPAANGEFVVGPSFGVPTPVELTIAFVRDSNGDIAHIAMRQAGVPERRAEKVPLTEQDIEFRSATATLAGTLIVPNGNSVHPAITLLHGSGPLTRRSFGPYPYFFASLGFAVLVYDKRGTGDSTGMRLDASTGRLLATEIYPSDILDDAAAAFRFLEAHSAVDRTKVGFWGSSEGGMLATQAAAQLPDVAFAINSSGFMGPLWQTTLYQAGAYPRRAGAPENEIAEYVAFTQQWLDVARTGAGWDAFVERREQIRRKNPEALFWSSGEFTSVGEMRWYWDHVLSFSPLPALANVKAPVLGVFGELDVSTEAPVAAENLRRALTAAGNRDVTVRIFPGADHSLSVESGAGMAPDVFDTLRSWLRAHVATD